MGKNRKVLLVRAPERRLSVIQQLYTPYESLGLGYIAAFLRQHGHEITIIDGAIQKLSIEQTVEEIKNHSFDLIGFTVPSGIVYPQTIEIAHEIRKNNQDVPICFGGHHATLVHRKILEDFPKDQRVVVVRGEGEYTSLELVENIDNIPSYQHILGLTWCSGDEIIENPSRPFIQDLDSLPFPARDHLETVLANGGEVVITASRGCYFKCRFCSIHAFYNHTRRTRSARNVMEEIKEIQNLYQCRNFWFIDDDFFVPKTKGNQIACEIFDLIIQEGLSIEFDLFCRATDVDRDTFRLASQAGLRNAMIGVESGVQRILNFYYKGITVKRNKEAVRIVEDAGANAIVEFIMFDPWMSLQEVEENLSFLKEIHKYNPYNLSSKLIILAHTPLYDDIKAGKTEPLPPISAEKVRELSESYKNFYLFYEFQDAYVKSLFQIITQAWRWIEPIEYELAQLENAIRIHGGTAESQEYYEQLQKLVNESALDIFEKTLAGVKILNPMDEEAVKLCQEDAEHEAHNLSIFIVSIVKREIEIIQNQSMRTQKPTLTGEQI